MALSSLTFTGTSTQNWTAVENVAGLPQGNRNTNQPSAQVNLGTNAANAAVGGSNEIAFVLSQPAASGTSVINLQSLTDVVGNAVVVLVRIKFIRFKLVGSAEFAPNGTTAGTACSSVTIGNDGSNPAPIFLGATTDTFVLNGGAYGEALQWESPTASGVAVSSSAKNLLITNNDSVNAGVVVVTIVGATS